MLNNILSKLFLIGSLLAGLVALTNTGIQYFQKPIKFKYGTETITIGQPGMRFTASRSNANETAAPYTEVKLKRVDSTGQERGSGSYFINEPQRMEGVEKMFSGNREPGDSIVRDSIFCFLAKWNPISTSDNWGYDTYEPQEDNTIMYVHTSIRGKDTTVEKKSFPNERAARFYGGMRDISPIKELEQTGMLREDLVLQAKGPAQRIGFALYELICRGCPAILLFLLSRLFRNFSRRDYFVSANVRILKWSGVLLLIPQLVAILVYWFWLLRFTVTRIQTGGEYWTWHTAGYGPLPDVDGSYVFLGLALLVLSYVFRDGLRLKTQETVTI